MRLLRAVFDFWTSPDSDPWLVLAREQFAAFSRNHRHLVQLPNRTR